LALIRTTFGEVDTFCDTLCTVTMADACRFFVYDYINRQCDLYGTEASADISSYCNEEGGPAVPELAKCAPSKPQICSVKTVLLITFSKNLNFQHVLAFIRGLNMPIATMKEKSLRHIQV